MPVSPDGPWASGLDAASVQAVAPVLFGLCLHPGRTLALLPALPPTPVGLHACVQVSWSRCSGPDASPGERLLGTKGPVRHGGVELGAPGVSLCPEPGLNALLFPRPWPALGPRPGPGPASGDGRCPRCPVGPWPCVGTRALAGDRCLPQPAAWPPPPPCHVAASTRAAGSRALFLQCFGGLLLQATPGRSPRNIIKEREGERESGRRQGPGRFGKTI